jgi:hypothetical protein
MMQNGRKRWFQKVPDRLGAIYERFAQDRPPLEVIHDLYDLDLISEHYDLRCLAVDVWYLFDRRRIHANKQFAAFEDASLRIMFGVVVQAVADARSCRPCDSYSWVLDRPPGDGERCSPTIHVCAPDAIRYLQEVASICEATMGISERILVDLVAKKNGSLRSRSAYVISCMSQEYR